MQVFCQLNIQLAGDSLGLRRVVDGDFCAEFVEAGNCGFSLRGQLDWKPGKTTGWAFAGRLALLCVVMRIPLNILEHTSEHGQ